MDTIELLEAIGSDAGLRHAPRDVLLDMLAQVGASVAITEAVARGDRAPLAAEFGGRAYCSVESTHSPPGREGEDGDEDGEDEPEEPNDPSDEGDHGS